MFARTIARPVLRSLPVLIVAFTLCAIALAQQAPAKSGPSPASQSSPQKPNPASDLGKSPATRPSQAPEVLQQLNSAFEALTAKVSPAVVQILVTGYGTVDAGSHGETALIARQHALGSGVIVDPDGYIMTNAHVVEGAQRIRVVLPMPSVDFPQIAPVGKEHVLDAKLIGMHKETDLALLKIEQTGLQRWNWGAPGACIRGNWFLPLAVRKVCKTRSLWAW